jgi:hypothetical protein
MKVADPAFEEWLSLERGRFRLMTSGVVAGIHVEALRVWPAEPLVAQENRASSALAGRTGSVRGKYAS